MRRSILFLWLFSYFLCFNLNANDLKLFKNFGAENLLSYQFVRAITQDEQGFIWFGSHEGLHRFDGYQFLSFHHDTAKPNSLSSDVISSLVIDDKNRFWVGTSGGGLNLYRSKTQDFIHINSESSFGALTNNVVNVLFEDSNGSLWVGTENGLNIVTESNGKIEVKQILQELGNTQSLTHNTIHDISESDDQKIWVATLGGGVSVFDFNGNFEKSVKFGTVDLSDYSNKFVNAIHIDGTKVWLGTSDNGLLKYDSMNNSLEHFQFEASDPRSILSNTIKKIYQDSKGKLWIATDKGLLIYNEVGNDFTRYVYSATNPFSLSNDFILSFYEDRTGLMWIGTFTGVNRWDPNMTTFEQYSSQTYKDILNDNVTNFAIFGNDTLVFSTYSGGVYLLSRLDRSIKRLKLSSELDQLRVMSLHMDENTLWIGTRASGLFSYDLITEKLSAFQHDENNPNSISANSITDIESDWSGNIWVTTFHKGLNRLNADGTFTRFIQNTNDNSAGPSSNHLLHIVADHENSFWISTYGGGLNRFDPKTGKFRHFRHDPNVPGTLSSDLAWYVLQDKERNLWVGTQAAGLNFLSAENLIKKNYHFYNFDTKDGMKSKTVYGIEQDENGKIWLSSNKGISNYSPQTKEFKHYGLSHGLIDLEYNHGAILKGGDGNLYFGSGKGVASVNPGQAYVEKKAPEVRIVSIYKLNESIPLNEVLSDSMPLSFEHNDQLIAFEYVGLDYANAESTTYKYRLDGFDSEWIEAGKLRRATYTNLPQGNYQLQVIAGNSDGMWGEPLTLDIVMHPAPWLTWWAYLIYAVILTFALLAYSRIVNRQLQIEQHKKEHFRLQVEEKTQEHLEKNIELEQANKELERVATVDKVTGLKSRRYLDIYIEQASQLMGQIHHNLLPVQRNILPRLYLLMIKVKAPNNVNNSQLMNLTDLLLYSRNTDDVVVRWSDDTFALIGYEKGNNIVELCERLANRHQNVLEAGSTLSMAYSYFPFNREQPLAFSWDQVSVLVEKAIKLLAEEETLKWIGLCEPKTFPCDYIELLNINSLKALKAHVITKESNC